MESHIKNRLSGVRLDGFFVYGCESCSRGFPMFVETGLEGVNDGPAHKPVPFSIVCPFCGSTDCHDVHFRKYAVSAANIKHLRMQKVDPRRRRVPYFANVPGDPCGRPTDMESAVCIITKPQEEAAHASKENSL